MKIVDNTQRMVTKCPKCGYAEFVTSDCVGMTGECSGCGSHYVVPGAALQHNTRTATLSIGTPTVASNQEAPQRHTAPRVKQSESGAAIIGFVLGLFLSVLGVVLACVLQVNDQRKKYIIPSLGGMLVGVLLYLMCAGCLVNSIITNRVGNNFEEYGDRIEEAGN